jgi:phage major head subunit gpT-like protein
MKKRIFFIAMLVAIVALPVFASTGTGSGFDSTGLVGMGVVGLGLVVSAGTLSGLQKSFNAIFNEALAAYPPDWPSFAMRVNSTGGSEDYELIGDTPEMREWLGDKFIKELLGFHQVVVNKDWEATIRVLRKNIEDDQLGMYNPKIQQLAMEANIKQDSEVSSLRAAGTATLCFDGKNFYAANHQTGKSGVQSNLLAGAGADTLAHITTDFKAARTAFRKFKTDTGKKFIRESGKLKLLVTCPPELESFFEELANSTLIGGSDNVLKGAFTFRVDSNLADTADWYVDYIGSPLKPFVMQIRKDATFVSMDQPDSENVFMKAAYLYSTEARFAAALGLWPYSVKINN